MCIRDRYTHNVGVLGLFPAVSNTYFTQSFSGTHLGTHTTKKVEIKWRISESEKGVGSVWLEWLDILQLQKHLIQK